MSGFATEGCIAPDVAFLLHRNDCKEKAPAVGAFLMLVFNFHVSLTQSAVCQRGAGRHR